MHGVPLTLAQLLTINAVAQLSLALMFQPVLATLLGITFSR